jgi:hypothetical protein
MKTGLSLIILTITFSTFGQTLNFDIGRPFSEFRKLEVDLSSKFQKSTSTHMLAADMAQPIGYLRVSDNFEPKPIVQYFFKKADSTVQEILYEWDKQNFNERNYQMTAKDIESRERFELFIQKYRELKNEITKQFGDSRSEGSLDPKSELSYLEVRKKDSWDNDSISVVMYITFTNQYEVRGSMTLPPAHRIRVYVKTKNDTHGNPSDHLKTAFKVDEKQQKIAEKYIDLLLTGKTKDSWELISPDIKSRTTYENYVKAVEPIERLKTEFGRDIELALSGPKFFNSETYYTYSFKFSADKSSPPKVFLDVTFKIGEEFISGFQPKKLGTGMN